MRKVPFRGYCVWWKFQLPLSKISKGPGIDLYIIKLYVFSYIDLTCNQTLPPCYPINIKGKADLSNTKMIKSIYCFPYQGDHDLHLDIINQHKMDPQIICRSIFKIIQIHNNMGSNQQV